MDTLPEDAERGIVSHAARMRVLGLALGLPPLAVVLGELSAPPIMWALAAANVFVWPWVARRRALADPRPIAVEQGNLLVDSLMGGVWVALMQFNPVPSAVLASVLLMDKFAFGGPRLALRCVIAFAAAAALLSGLNLFAFTPTSSSAAILASLPLLLVYPSAVALASHRLGRQVGGQAEAIAAMDRRDALTGVANRRALMEATEHEFRRFRRSGHRASFMVVDIDRFRQLNEAHGPAAGDKALRAIADILQRTLRDTDTCGRLEGDRFGIVLADASGSGVGELAERLRHAVASGGLQQAGGLHPTISIGIAQVDASMRCNAQWIEAAESALRAAKNAGRNRSMSAPAHGSVAP